MNTSKKQTNSKLITFYSRKYRRIVDFIAEYDGKKYVKIYSPNMYPLYTANGPEGFLIVADEYSYYIIKTTNNKFKAIYNINGKILLEAKEKQSIFLIPQESIKSFAQNLRKTDNDIIERLDNTLNVVIYEKGKKTLLFNIPKNENILESTYIGTKLFQNNKYFFEKSDDKIKAIYNIDGTLALKSDENFLRINDKFYIEEIYSVNEIYSDGKCHSIYIRPTFSFKFEKVITDYTFDLSIFDISYSFDQNNILILGKLKEKCKALFLYKINIHTLKTSPMLNTNSKYDKYFEVVLKNTKDDFYIKVMLDKNCIELLNSNFTSIISLDKIKDDISNTSLEIAFFNEETFIKKIYNKKCIAIYDIMGNLCSIADNKDTDIILFTGYNKSIIFMHKLNNNYIRVESNNLPTLSSFIFEPVIKDNEVIAVYGIKDGKRVSIYNFKLYKVVSYEELENVSLEIAFCFINEEGDPLEFDEDFIIYQDIIYLKYDSDDKCRNIYNEKNELILQSQEDHYFKTWDKYILEYENNKCIAFYSYVNNCINNVLGISSSTCEFFLYITSKNCIFVEEYDNLTKKNIALYKKCYVYFDKIISKYCSIEELDNYLILSFSDSNDLELIKISYNYYEKSKGFIVSPSHGGTLKITTDSLNNIYAYELNENEKIIAIYYLDDNVFVETISSDSEIEIIKKDNFEFFKTNGKLYNLLGNEI